MSDKVVVDNEIVEESTNIVRETASAVADTAHNALKLSLGVADMAREEVTNRLEKVQTEIADLLNRLSERGESVETESRKLIDERRKQVEEVIENRRKQVEEVIENRRQQVNEVVGDATSELDTRIAAVLENMNIPTKEDIDALSKKIGTLTRKINALAKEQKKA